MRILIGDDNSSDRMLLAKVLAASGLGVEVTEASTGAEILEAARTRSLDLIISDVLMPEMDAFTMLRELRREPGALDIPVIFYSAHYVSPQDEELAYKLGVSKFIVKPTEPSSMIAEIQHALDDHVAGRIKANVPLLQSEEEYLRRYSERVVRQLEKKLEQLSDEVQERRRCELDARADEERFKAIFERSIVGIAEVGRDGRFISANPSFKEMLGLDHGDVEQEYIFDYIHPDETGDQRELWDALVRGESHAVRTEARYVRRDDRAVWLRESLSTIPGTTAGQGYVLLLAEDITDNKQAEEALKESEEHFRALFAESFDAVLVSEEGLITDANPAAEDMFGFSREELIGRMVSSLVAESDRNMVSEHIRKHDKTRYECEAMRKDGSVFDVEVAGQTRSFKGRVLRITALKDVTAHRRATEVIKQRDVAIRKAYVDVFSAVTGEKLVILMPEEVESALGEQVSPHYAIDSFEKLADARSFLRGVIAEKFSDVDRAQQVILAAGEAITNAVKHGGGGDLTVYRQEDTLQVKITDRGSGIDFKLLPRATLLQGFSTKQSLGIGFSVMLEVCDRVLLSTEPGNTTVILEIGKGEPAKSLDEILQSGLRSV